MYKAVALLLLIHCILLFPLFVGVLCLSLFHNAVNCVILVLRSPLKEESWLFYLKLCFYCHEAISVLCLFLVV